MSVAAPDPAPGDLLFDSADWTFERMDRTYAAIEEIALGDLGLDVYANQIEIISSEQMLDAYSSFGMPLMYQHWSFGKRFARDSHLYRGGHTGLAYEIVINSNPCISYNMEDNSMALQALVMAHAAFGHNHFFKNNYLFRQWTDADTVLDQFQAAKNLVSRCEQRHGFEAVEATLDAAHAIMDQGVFRYARPPEPTREEIKRRRRELQDYAERSYNDLWRTVPRGPEAAEADSDEQAASARRRALKLPEENLLYFLELNSPSLEDWQRELLAMVRGIAQYFYPQRQTKVMNEGCATFVHYTIMQTLYDRGHINDGAMLEILQNHSNVVMQPEFDDPRFSGLNPYALGFNMMCDIRRICETPTDEDREWFPDIAGDPDWRGVLKRAWADYRDESFIRQFLSPHLMRKMKLFAYLDRSEADHVEISAIHNRRGYRGVREALARTYDPAVSDPDIQVHDADLKGDRVLQLRHTVRDGVLLGREMRDEVLKHVRTLWGYDVTLQGIDGDSDRVLYTVPEPSEPEILDTV